MFSKSLFFVEKGSIKKKSKISCGKNDTRVVCVFFGQIIDFVHNEKTKKKSIFFFRGSLNVGMS